MYPEKRYRNTKIFLEKCGYDPAWVNSKLSHKELEHLVKKALKRKKDFDPKSYRELSYPKSAGGYGLSTSYLQIIVNRERKRYGK